MVPPTTKRLAVLALATVPFQACGGANEASDASDAGRVDSDGPLGQDGAQTAADAPPEPDAGDCAPDGVRGRGRHRLFVQGHGAPPQEDGTWPLLHPWARDGGDAPLCDDAVFTTDDNGDGLWQPGEEPHPLGPGELVHGEHFLVGPGAFVEFTIHLCDDITGNVTFYIPNFDEEGSVAMHQLLVVRDGAEQLVAEVIDDEPGSSGYNPFIRIVEGVDPVAEAGDILLLRSVNLSGAAFSVMVWQPPSEYESWIVVEVP